jgi:hypothetical protein
VQAEYSDGTPAGAAFDKDELTHAAYWQLMGFEDPTPADKQSEFAMCGSQCGSDLHDEAADRGELLLHLSQSVPFDKYSSDRFQKSPYWGPTSSSYDCCQQAIVGYRDV